MLIPLLLHFLWNSMGAAASQSFIFDCFAALEEFQINGEKFSEAAESKVSILRFWSSTCPHARDLDFKVKEGLYEIRDKVLLVDINSNLDSDPKNDLDYRKRSNLKHPLIYDSSSVLAKAFLRPGRMPSFLCLIEKDGLCFEVLLI